MSLPERHIQRVHALRLRGQWTASADDGGERIGHGAGFSWESAVRDALRDLDEKRVVKDATQLGKRG